MSEPNTVYHRTDDLNMILQNPGFLWGLLLLAIPVIVHLFDFRRIKKIQFSNVAFLQTIQKQNTPRRRVREILILLARLLAITFLILAFARPVIPDKAESFSSGDNLLVLDNSQSMIMPCQGIPCFEAAKIAGLEVAKSYEQGRFFYQGAYRLKRFIGPNELEQLFDQLTLSRSSLELNFDEDLLGRSQIAVLSDFQEKVVNEVEKLAADSVPLLLIPISPTSRQNLYVDSVFLQNPFSIGNNKRILGVKLANSGSEKIENALVRIFNEDRQLSSVAVSLESNAFEEVLFEIENSQNPQFRVEVEDFEVDFDNDYFLSMPHFEPIKVSILGGEKSRAIDAIFENEEYFDLEIFSNSSIDFERFFSSDLVVIHSLDQLPAWFDLDRLTSDVVIIPSLNADVANYSSRLASHITRSSDTTFSALKSSSFEHPFFEGIFNGLDSRVAFPNVKSMFSVARASEVLLSGDRPYLQLLGGDRKVYWFSGPLKEGFSELQNHALFLPVMYRFAENSKSFNEPLAHLLSRLPLEIKLESPSTQLLELKGENGQFIPSSYFNQTSLILTLPPELNDPGFYYLTEGTDTLKVLALNTDRSESELNGLDAEKLKEHFGAFPNAQILASSTPNELRNDLSELSDEKQLWKYALLLALMFLVVETAFQRWPK